MHMMITCVPFLVGFQNPALDFVKCSKVREDFFIWCCSCWGGGGGGGGGGEGREGEKGCSEVPT